MKKSFLCGDRKSDEGLAEYFNLPFFGVMYKPKNTKNKFINNLIELTKYLDLK